MRPSVLAIALFLNPAAHNLTGDSRNNLIPTDRFIEDMRRKDIDDILTLYSSDAVFVDPAGNKFDTPEARQKLYQQTFATFDTENLVFEHLHTVITGPFGSETVEQQGFYSEDLRTRATDKVQRFCGGYHVAYKHHVDSLQSDRTPAHEPESKWLITLQEWTSTPCPALPVN